MHRSDVQRSKEAGHSVALRVVNGGGKAVESS